MEKIDLNHLMTESRNENSRDLHLKSTNEILKIINDEDAKIALAIENNLSKIGQAVEIIYQAVSNGGRLFYLGAGTSGRLGVLDASEMLPTFGIDDLIIGLIAGGDEALKNPIEGAEDDSLAAIKDLEPFNLNANDVVLVIGASGRTPYCLGALNFAKTLGIKTISLCMTANSEFEKISDLDIAILVGPEVVTGSTRMKSGTATKMVLNMISTALMIKLDKVYDNLMIDVQATNLKLENRCFKIVKDLTNADDQLIWDVLKTAKMSVKISLVAIKKNISVVEAETLLKTQSLKELF